VIIVVLFAAIVLVVIVRLLTWRLPCKDGVGGLQASFVTDAEEIDDRFDALARLPATSFALSFIMFTSTSTCCSEGTISGAKVSISSSLAR
jgi:hypothetical protein